MMLSTGFPAARSISSLNKCVPFDGITMKSTIASSSFGAIVKAKPGDDLAQIASKLRPGDELVLADGNYANVSIDFGRKWNLTVRAANVVPVRITRENDQPIAKPASGVLLNGKG